MRMGRRSGSENGLGPDGAAALAPRLGRFTTLQNLYIRWGLRASHRACQA